MGSYDSDTFGPTEMQTKYEVERTVKHTQKFKDHPSSNPRKQPERRIG